MNSKNIEKGKEAYYNYITKEETIEKDILLYLAARIKANEDTIGELIKITKEKIDMKKIQSLLAKESRYKSKKTIKMDADGNVRGTLITQKGVLLIEENEVEKVVEAYIDAIISRNAIVVADAEYLEISVKNLILEIIQIALEKFNVDKNLIQLLPAEEVNAEEFNSYKENEKVYVYLEDRDFENEVLDKKYIIEGEIDEVIERINKEGICKCAVIYTKDKEKAYKFLNIVNGKNVFVNATIENMEEDIEIDDLYIYKHIIYPTK